MITKQIENLRLEVLNIEEENGNISEVLKIMKSDMKYLETTIRILNKCSFETIKQTSPLISQEIDRLLDISDDYTKKLNDNKNQIKKINKAIDSLETLLPDNNINPI